MDIESSALASSAGPRDSESGNGSVSSYSSATNTSTGETQNLEPRDPVEINLRTLLEAGAHFGHQTARWHPAMAPYIYGIRNGIHVVNLPKTVAAWQTARKAIVDVVARGGNVLFVGTKKQAQQVVMEEAQRCGAFYVSRRWLGGMITNFQTIRQSIDRIRKLEETLETEDQALKNGSSSKFTKKERLIMSREIGKLEYSLGGIKDLYGPPQLIFVIDIRREDIAVREAKRLDIPVVALVDTNCDPREVTHAIPSNDDGTRVIRLFCQAVCDAIVEGKAKRRERTFEAAKEQEKSADEAGEAEAAPDSGKAEQAAEDQKDSKKSD